MIIFKPKGAITSMDPFPPPPPLEVKKSIVLNEDPKILIQNNNLFSMIHTISDF